MSYRENLRALCTAEDKPAPETVKQVLYGVDPVSLLDFMVEEAEKLLSMVEDIPNLIFDGLEDGLASDVASKQELDAVMARLLAK